MAKKGGAHGMTEIGIERSYLKILRKTAKKGYVELNNSEKKQELINKAEELKNKADELLREAEEL